MIDAILQIVSKESPRALYRGLVPTLAQIAPQTGFQFGFYSLLTSIWELMFGQKVNGVHQVGESSLSVEISIIMTTAFLMSYAECFEFWNALSAKWLQGLCCPSCSNKVHQHLDTVGLNSCG